MVSIDTETSGLDLNFSARPYFVTVCWEDGMQRFWEWNVDPLTRAVDVPSSDLAEIRRVLEVARGWERFDAETQEGHVVVGQNIGFDVKALASVGIKDWPWGMTRDTLLAGHLLGSNEKHNLTDMATSYLKVNIQPFEDALKDACTKARRIVQQARLRRKKVNAKAVTAKMPKEKAIRFDAEGGFVLNDLFSEEDRKEIVGTEKVFDPMIAEEGLPGMPSVKGSSGGDKVEKDRLWKNDGWLPRAMMNYWRSLDSPGAKLLLEEHAIWDTALRDYANTDSFVTLALWKRMRELLKKRNLWAIYLERLKLLPVINDMETRGVTVSKVRLEELQQTFTEQLREHGETCLNIAGSMGYDLKLPKGASPNGSLREFCFDVLKLPPRHSAKSKTDAPSLDKLVMEDYLVTLPEWSKQLRFVQALRDKRKRDTALSFLESYKRFSQPCSETDDFLVLHPSLNATGTDTLRMSSSNPNGQQISKQEDECGHCEGGGCSRCGDTGYARRSLRYCFGPALGREWWSLDYENIELRIPAYESGERCMIELFEKPDELPFFGSYHLLNASIIYPDLFWPLAEQKGAFKDKYAATWYQWCKNAGFALIYGCQERKFDETCKKRGAYMLLRSKLSKLFALSDRMIQFANKHGYVETIPDKTVDPRRGYPILCSRSEWGGISPTIPLNYRVSPTAMWCTCKAMPRCWNYLRDLSRQDTRGYYLTLQVHDEMVFDFPQEPNKGNLPKVLRLKQLMEQSGEDIGIPLKVAVTYNPVSWGEKG